MQLEQQPDQNQFSPLEDQIRECFGRVVYTHKAHEKMADRCSATLQRYKLCQIGATVEPISVVVRNTESHFHESSSRVFGIVLVSGFLLPPER